MKVTLADVTRVARKYLDPSREVVAVVKPPVDSPGAARAAARAGHTANPQVRGTEAGSPAQARSEGAAVWK